MVRVASALNVSSPNQLSYFRLGVVSLPEIAKAQPFSICAAKLKRSRLFASLVETRFEVTTRIDSLSAEGATG